MVRQKCQNCTFKVNFLCQKSTEIFQKKNSFKNINLGEFVKKNLTSIFETLYFLKSCPIFDEQSVASIKYVDFWSKIWN